MSLLTDEELDAIRARTKAYAQHPVKWAMVTTLDDALRETAVVATVDRQQLLREVDVQREIIDDMARLIERQRREVRAAALDEVQEFVVAHAFDTTVGRRIDDFITALLEANKG